MPRKAFVADLQEATRLFERNNVSCLRAGGEDGMINFNYHMSESESETTEITVMVPGMCPLPHKLHNGISSRHQHSKRVIHKSSNRLTDFRYRSWRVPRITYVHDLHGFRECPSSNPLSVRRYEQLPGHESLRHDG